MSHEIQLQILRLYHRKYFWVAAMGVLGSLGGLILFAVQARRGFL